MFQAPLLQLVEHHIFVKIHRNIEVVIFWGLGAQQSIWYVTCTYPLPPDLWLAVTATKSWELLVQKITFAIDCTALYIYIFYQIKVGR